MAGLDASTFLRFLRMVRSIFTVTCVISVALIVINIIYNMKNVPSEARTALSLLTIANVSGSWAWPALASSYLISASLTLSLSFELQTDHRLYHHVFHLEKLEDYGLPSKSMVPIPCLSEQDLFEDAHGHSDQEGLQE
jgi:hypothetical protein